jgi:dipeptidyl aminopeptidase/acylaminoacyl peptidase
LVRINRLGLRVVAAFNCKLKRKGVGMMHKQWFLVCSTVVVLSLSACSTAPTHPSLSAAASKAQLAPLIPIHRLVANTESTGAYVLSPDGEKLLWQQAVGTDVGLAVRSVAKGSPVSTFATGNQGRQGGIHTWLADNRHIVYSKDPSGDENVQFFVQDTHATFSPWAVTPWTGIRSEYLGRSSSNQTSFFFTSNKRDKRWFDVYEADANTRTINMLMQNDGSIQRWSLDANGRVAARVRKLGSQDGADTVTEWLKQNGEWQALKTVGGFDTFYIVRINRQIAKAWAISNIGRNTSALVEINLKTGEEIVLGANEDVDISYVVFGAQAAPIAYVIEPDYPKIVFLDSAMETSFNAMVNKALTDKTLPAQPIFSRPLSAAKQRMVLRSSGHFDVAELLVDFTHQTVERLNPQVKEASQTLVASKPFSFKASDGRTIQGYISRPLGVEGSVPLIMNIHGGPMARDSWAPATFDQRQLLTNRGYAVMNVNYRGSSGYGKEHMWAGANEYSGRLQQDIAQAVQWAIDQGIADSKRLAVMGGSFGGFSTLMQLAQKPHDYRCGVDIVGVSNWPRVIESWPPFWQARHYFDRFYGDVTKPDVRAKMLENSPISHIEKITAPLLVIHGGNDVRVLKQDSDDVVAKLRQLNRPVEYMIFEDEGHSISKWRNRLAMWRKIEDTFASCLGGRSAGFDLYELMPR